MNPGDDISVLWVQPHNGGTILTVEERVFTDPSCGQWTSGWYVFDKSNDDEYFIDDAGDVYRIGESICIGVSPVMATEYRERCKRAREMETRMLLGGM